MNLTSDIFLFINHLTRGDDLSKDDEQIARDQAVPSLRVSRALVKSIRHSHYHQANYQEHCGITHKICNGPLSFNKHLGTYTSDQ